MKRIVFGVVIGVCTFVAGVGADRLAMGVLDRQSLPEVAVVPDNRVYDAELCDLLGNPEKYDRKIVRVKVRRGLVGGTFFGLLSANACPGFVHAQCPGEETCSLLPNLIGRTEFAKTDAVVIGTFFAENDTLDPMVGFRANPLIAIQNVVEIKPMLDCPNGSEVEVGTECPKTFHNEIDLRINGIGVGSSYKEVVSAFGQPSRTAKGRYHEFEFEREVSLIYHGLVIDLLYAPDRTVVSFQVTSRRWDVSGIRVGDDESVLWSKFGAALYGPNEDPDDKSVYTYASDAGIYVTFKIRNGKIVEIWSAVPTC